MTAQADARAATHDEVTHDKSHPTPGLYVRIGIVLFVLTALEVGLYEYTYGDHAGATGVDLRPFFVPILLALSAAKFALVAGFYMHLKQDSRLFSGVFVFSLLIATIVVVSMAILMAYHLRFAKAGG